MYLQVAGRRRADPLRLLPDGPASEHGEAHVAAHDRLRYEDGAPIPAQLGLRRAHRAPQAGHRGLGRRRPAGTCWWPAPAPSPAGPTRTGSPPFFLLATPAAPGRPRFARPEPILLDAGSPALFGGHSCVPSAPCSLSPTPGAHGVRLGYAGATHPKDLLVGSETGASTPSASCVDGKATVHARLERG